MEQHNLPMQIGSMNFQEGKATASISPIVFLFLFLFFIFFTKKYLFFFFLALLLWDEQYLELVETNVLKTTQDAMKSSASQCGADWGV